MTKTKRIIVIIIVLVLAAGGSVLLVGLFKGWHWDKIPYTLKAVERLTREQYFDENGNPILEYWTNQMMDYSKSPRTVKDYEAMRKLNITGFTCSKIKDVTTGKEEGYWIEFDNMGYRYGAFGRNYYSGLNGHFSYKESPFKKWGIEPERRYVNLNSGSAPFVGIMKDGLILSSHTYEGMEEKNLQADFRAYDPEKKEWIHYDTIEEWMRAKKNDGDEI